MIPGRLEGGHQRGHHPAIRKRVTPEGPPASKRETVAAAYLRAAHAYILISMPTGTSTIFGVFQAILALLIKPDELPRADNVMRNKKFASEIFCHELASFMLQRKMNSRTFATSRQNKDGSTVSELPASTWMLTSVRRRQANAGQGTSEMPPAP